MFARAALISAALVVALLAPPAGATTVTTPPSISGEARYLNTLTVTPATWDVPPASVSYQWLRDGQPITGATATTYVVTRADIDHGLSVTETAVDALGVATSATSQPAVLGQKAVFEVRKNPKVSGAFRQGQTLRIKTLGRMKPASSSVKFRWTREGRTVSRTKSYRLGYADVNRWVALEVTHRRPGFEPYRTVIGKIVKHRVPVRRTFTYSVATRGPVRANLAEFRAQAQQTYDDPRGWRAAGFAFRRVPRGGDFTLVLSTAGLVPSFSSACSSSWSCRVGRFVIINETRWQQASPAWNAAKRSRRDYRHMVVNHETGHWLGHGHAYCHRPGPAPVMMQQSKGRGVCSFNPWPLPSERWARR